MNLAKRARLIHAHSLRCQGLTYREIGASLECAASTVARYLREFDRRRDEIFESLAADLLFHSVAQLDTDDPDLHQQHINDARELRLLIDTLDRINDRRQRRFSSNGPDADLAREARKREESRARWSSVEHKPGEHPYADYLRKTSTVEQTHSEIESGRTDSQPQRPEVEQNETEWNKTEQESSQPPANPNGSRTNREKTGPIAPTDTQSLPNIPMPRPGFDADDIPDPPFNPKHLRPVHARNVRIGTR